MPQPNCIMALPVAEEETERESLRAVRSGAEDVLDFPAVAAFFIMSNRMASGVDMIPDREHHKMDR